MIEEIHIRDLGVITDARLPLEPGFSVLTGETGAGKTMVVTALGMLLGARSDASSVRNGAKSALAEAVILCPEAPCTCGNSSAVEHRLAKAGVASSNLVSRSTNFIWRHSQAVRQRSAKPLFPSSILGAASTKSLPMPGWRNRQTQRT